MLNMFSNLKCFIGQGNAETSRKRTNPADYYAENGDWRVGNPLLTQ